MRLYIGKNHRENAPVQSIFRLAGSDEDALTYALGYLLAYDQDFCAKLVRRTKVARYKSVKPGCSIHLQEVTATGFGRRDIVIEGNGMRVVLEAKIGSAEPTAEQLLKYGEEDRIWKQFGTRGIVALTQVELSIKTRDEVRSKLWRKGIRFSTIQWHEVLDLVLSHRPSGGSEIGRYLFNEFIRYIRRDYPMGYYDAEILIQDVNPLNTEIFKEGWMYVTSPKDKKAPLYFAPYFTRRGANSGLSMISRVKDTQIVRLADTAYVGDLIDAPTDGHLKRWRKGLCKLRIRAEKEGFDQNEVRLFFLDQPITFRPTPLSKKFFNSTGPRKQIPNQIPKGFTLGFDDLLISLSENFGA